MATGRRLPQASSGWRSRRLIAEPPLPLTVRIREACRFTGISRSNLYELIEDGRVKTIKVGAITSIPMAELTAFLELDQAVNLSVSVTLDRLIASRGCGLATVA